MARKTGVEWWKKRTRKARKRIGQLKESQDAVRRNRGSD